MPTPKDVGHAPPCRLVLLCASQLTLTGEQGAGALGVPPAALMEAVHHPPQTYPPSGQCRAEGVPLQPLGYLPKSHLDPPTQAAL